MLGTVTGFVGIKMSMRCCFHQEVCKFKKSNKCNNALLEKKVHSTVKDKRYIRENLERHHRRGRLELALKIRLRFAKQRREEEDMERYRLVKA